MRTASQSYIHGVLNALSTRLETKNMARVMSSSSAAHKAMMPFMEKKSINALQAANKYALQITLSKDDFQLFDTVISPCLDDLVELITVMMKQVGIKTNGVDVISLAIIYNNLYAECKRQAALLADAEMEQNPGDYKGKDWEQEQIDLTYELLPEILDGYNEGWTIATLADYKCRDCDNAHAIIRNVLPQSYSNARSNVENMTKGLPSSIRRIALACRPSAFSDALRFVEQHPEVLHMLDEDMPFGIDHRLHPLTKQRTIQESDVRRCLDKHYSIFESKKLDKYLQGNTFELYHKRMANENLYQGTTCNIVLRHLGAYVMLTLSLLVRYNQNQVRPWKDRTFHPDIKMDADVAQRYINGKVNIIIILDFSTFWIYFDLCSPVNINFETNHLKSG